jgi:hypothetical protein
MAEAVSWLGRLPTCRTRRHERLATADTEPRTRSVLALTARASPSARGGRPSFGGVGPPLAGSHQRHPIIRRKLQRLGQALQRVEVGESPRAAFQVRDAAHTQPRPLRQRLLRQARRGPIPAQVRAEVPSSLSGHRLGPANADAPRARGAPASRPRLAPGPGAEPIPGAPCDLLVTQAPPAPRRDPETPLRPRPKRPRNTAATRRRHLAHPETDTEAAARST